MSEPTCASPGNAPSAAAAGSLAQGAVESRWANGVWLSRLRTLTTSGLVSLLAHLVFLLVVAQIRLPQTGHTMFHEVRSWMVEEPPLPAALPDPVLELAEPQDDPTDSPLQSAALAAAAVVGESQPVIESPTNTDDAELLVPDAPLEPLAAERLDAVLVRDGAVGEEVTNVEGAVDRIAYEIISYLSESDVLVVWLMDASLSLRDERSTVAQRLEHIYAQIAEAAKIATGDLLSAVYRFGSEHEELVAPTAEVADVVAAIQGVADDDSGREAVFTAIADAARRYQPYRARQKRKLLMVVWTDESGDDDRLLEDAADVCRRLTIPVYVVGPSSMFGTRQGTHAFTLPDTGQTVDLPVDRGPDTVRPELLRLPFWFDGPAWNSYRGGVGPYALTRLARETGGAYFISDAAADRSPFDLATLRRYLPEYQPATVYLRGVSRSPLRQAVLAAVDATYQRELKATPRLEFAPTGETYQQELLEAQELVAYNLLTIEQSLTAFGDKSLEQEYLEEQSPRWRAWFDLTLGRLLAMHVRCNEYNWACAVLKAKGPEFVDQQSNRWRLVPDAELHFGTTSEREAAEARRLLERCSQEHAGTPWAALAQQELAQPFGFRLIEAYVPPPPPPPPGDTPQPPTGMRMEQLRSLPRAPVFPKL